jgi:hypothetical protein
MEATVSGGLFYSSSSCSIRPASATNASTAIITTVVNETAIVGMGPVL